MGETPSIPHGPTDQHEQMMNKVGEWKVACQYFLGGETVAAEGVELVEALGPYWTVGHFRCEMMGTEIAGVSTSGFDPAKGKYTGTWQDSATPYFYYFEGGIDEDGRLVMEGENYDPITSSTATYRSIQTLGKDQRTLELYSIKPETDPFQVLEYTYTRA